MDKKQPSDRLPFPVVGIGASAGGLAAFEAFFSGIPVDKKPEMAFVLVQHLDPHHPSLLTELVRTFTDLQVREVTDGTPVQVNEVFVIPPGKSMTINEGSLHLADQEASRGLQLPVDLFFRSLAVDRGNRSVAVVLSGTGGDGAQGIREINKEGGLVLVQEEGSAEYDGMPENAEKTGLVNFRLPPDRMVAQIQAHFQLLNSGSPRKKPPTQFGDDDCLQQILGLLHTKTSHDFAKYKPSTIRRRIARRMAVSQTGTLNDYLALMVENPEEVTALFGDLLIGVTSFFRDPKVFQFLENRIIPRVIENSGTVTPVRVWSAGCSTGEEPYSLAIQFYERLQALGIERRVNIFATDIDDRAISAARAGRFPAAIASDLTEDRLHRFFTTGHDGSAYKIKKTIRDTIVFSKHDLIKDPPFFKLDLIVCRNLLIYLGLELQRKIIPMFHYALKPGGTLVLGTSETIGEFGHLFQTVDQACKIFVRKETLSDYPRTESRFPPFLKFIAPAPGLANEQSPVLTKVPLKTLTEQAILKVQDMAAALVNAQGEVLYLHGHTGYFLEPPTGVTGMPSILKMAKEGLRYPLANAFQKAVATNQAVQVRDLQVLWRGSASTVRIGIYPVDQEIPGPPAPPLFLVLLEEAPSGETGPVATDFSVPEVKVQIEKIMRELADKEEYLRSTTQEMESSNEELRSANEELQSVNEELQSTNEEMETSKEELQSVNEELSTVNAELNSKIVELTTTNTDTNNLLAATGVATIFVDLGLNILWFTPEATRVINLIPGDLGRPVGHLASKLADYRTLDRDAQGVLDTLVPKEVEVRSLTDSWYRLRINPYRTVDNVIEGAVFSFIDITSIVRQREALRKNNELLRLVSADQDIREAVIVRNPDGRILAWGPGAVRMYGWTEDEALGSDFRQHIPPELREQPVPTPSVPYRSKRLTKDGKVIEVLVSEGNITGADGKAYALQTLEKSIGITMEP